MKKRIIVLALLVAGLASVEALAANIGGQWSGTGTVEMFIDRQTQGVADCSTFQFDVAQDGGTVVLNSGYVHCGASLEYTLSRHDFEIREGAIFENGKQVGAVMADRFQLTYVNGGETQTFDILVNEQGEAEYIHTWTDGYTLLVMNGKLKRL